MLLRGLVALCLASGAWAFGSSAPQLLRSSKALSPRALRSSGPRHSLLSPKAHGITMQVWSNNEAVQEYKDLLAGNGMVTREDCSAVIVGYSPVAEMLKASGGGTDITVDRGDEIPDTVDGLSEFPIYVCVHPNDLEDVIRSCPKDKVDDLVFMQDGMMEQVLKKYALCGDRNTQVCPFYYIPSVGARPQDCLTDCGLDSFGEKKFAGETAVCGKWSGAVVQRLERQKLHCKSEFYRNWRRIAIEKAVFDSVFNLIGILHKGITLGEVARYHQKEVETMITEINRALRASMAVTLMFGIEERLLAYAEHPNVEWKPAQIEASEFKWRNGFFYAISRQAADIGFDDPMPTHTQYLEYAQRQGIINFELETYSPFA